MSKWLSYGFTTAYAAVGLLLVFAALAVIVGVIYPLAYLAALAGSKR